MKKDINYSYTQIEVFATDNNYEIQEHGNNVIGENFLVLKNNDKDITVSFILTAYGDNTGNCYTCIYSDLN